LTDSLGAQTGRPHICFVAPAAWPVLAGDDRIESVGGAEVQQTLLARSFARRGYSVSMICMDYGQPDRAVVDGVTVFKCHARVQGPPVIRFFHPRLTGIWAALREVDADIYYQRSAAALTGVVALFARRYGRRFIYAAACDIDVARDQTWQLFHRRAGWRDRQLFQLGVKLADEIVVQNVGQVQDCKRSYGRVPTMIRSCCAAAPGYAAVSNGVVLWVSTLRTGKRPERFLELARRLPHLRFRMVGGPSAEPADAGLFQRIKEQAAGIANLEFVGFVPFRAIDAHFNAARIFVNTSDYEGFPNTFLQSWSRGIPTVSFFDPGSTLDGEPVVNVTGDLSEMAEMVDRLMHAERLWHKTSVRASSYYRSFHTPDAVMDVYDRLFGKWKFASGTDRSEDFAALKATHIPSSNLVKVNAERS
jgi:glycosyltransferase involved in cell wall biosynthesis